jgi:hypothetical protein
MPRILISIWIGLVLLAGQPAGAQPVNLLGSFLGGMGSTGRGGTGPSGTRVTPTDPLAAVTWPATLQASARFLIESSNSRAAGASAERLTVAFTAFDLEVHRRFDAFASAAGTLGLATTVTTTYPATATTLWQRVTSGGTSGAGRSGEFFTIRKDITIRVRGIPGAPEAAALNRGLQAIQSSLDRTVNGADPHDQVILIRPLGPVTP